MTWFSAHPVLDALGAIAFLCWVVRGAFWLADKNRELPEGDDEE